MHNSTIAKIKEDSPTLNIPERLGFLKDMVSLSLLAPHIFLANIKDSFCCFLSKGSLTLNQELRAGAGLPNKYSTVFTALHCLLFSCFCLQPKARSSPIYVAICMQIRGYFQMYSVSCRRQAAFRNMFFPRMIVRFSVSILLILHLLTDLFLTLISKRFKA